MIRRAPIHQTAVERPRNGQLRPVLGPFKASLSRPQTVPQIRALKCLAHTLFLDG